jgi:hypothetical protein
MIALWGSLNRHTVAIELVVSRGVRIPPAKFPISMARIENAEGQSTA